MPNKPPRRMAEEYQGRIGVCLREITTRGGVVFKKGSKVKIRWVDRGRLSIWQRNTDPNDIFGNRYKVCTDVHPSDIQLLPPRKPKKDE
jgi:hypothetical protein